MNKKRYYELKGRRSGVYLHAARRYLEESLDGPLFLSSAAIIALVCKNDLLFGGEEKLSQIFDKSFKTCDNIAYAARIQNSHVLYECYEIINNELEHFHTNFQTNYERIIKINDANEFRNKIKAILVCYADLYEGLYRCLSSFFVLSKLIINDFALPADLQIFVQSDPRRKIESLEDDTGAIVPSLPQLSYGCNRHLRNAINHTRWKIESHDSISFWDINSKGTQVWQQTYTINELKDELDQLGKTTEGMLLSYFVYQNNISLNEQCVFKISRGYYDDDVIKQFLEDAAFEMGLYVEAFTSNAKEKFLNLSIYIPDNLDIEQETEIVEGSRSPRVFKVKISVICKSAYISFLNFLGSVAGALLNYEKILISISDEKSGFIVQGEISYADMEEVYNHNFKKIKKMFSLLQKYTLKLTVEGKNILVR
jgi:hypothetical protein